MTELAEPPVAAPTLTDIAERYVALRDKKAQMDAEHKKKMEAINTAMNRCEAYLLATLNGMGVESVRTKGGTVSIQTATSATVADWPMVLDFIKQHELWAMLEKRVAKTVVAEYREEHNDIPPGINWTETRVLSIKRPTT
jgi:hypothetical protein